MGLVVTAEAAGGFRMPDVARIGPPFYFHVGKHIAAVGFLYACNGFFEKRPMDKLGVPAKFIRIG